MNKAEFLGQLYMSLSKLPQYEIDQSLAFYAEMIDDRIEEGMPEEVAVASLGKVGEIASQIIAETPIIPKTIAKAKTGSRTLNIVLLIGFSPIWVPIAISFLAAVFSIYIAIGAVIVSLWAVVFALVVSGFFALFASGYLLFTAFPLTALLIAGLGLVSIGIGLLSFFGVLAATKGLFSLTRLFARKVRSLFVKENVKERSHHE